MCFDLMNRIKICFGKEDGDSGRTGEVHSVRVFAVSPMNPKIYPDAKIYQIQEESKNKSDIKIKIKELHDFIQSNYPMEMTTKMLIDQKSTAISKMIQNLYVTSLGGITAKSMKVYRINLMINATNDLPNIDEEKIEMLRVPLNSNNPNSAEGFLDDVADKIQATSFKNISTLIYCYDGMCNSLVLVTCYFIKYTDLMLVEIAQHLAFSRNGYQSEDGFGPFTEMVLRFARKYRKITDDDDSSKFQSNDQITKPILSVDDSVNKENIVIAVNSEVTNEKQTTSNIQKSSSVNVSASACEEKSQQSAKDKSSKPPAKACKTLQREESSAVHRIGEKSYLSKPSPKNDKNKKDNKNYKSERKGKQAKEQSHKTQKKHEKSILSAPDPPKKDPTDKPKNAEKPSSAKKKSKREEKKDISKRNKSEKKLSKKKDKNAKKTPNPVKKSLKNSQDVIKNIVKSTRKDKDTKKKKKNIEKKKSLVKTTKTTDREKEDKKEDKKKKTKSGDKVLKTKKDEGKSKDSKKKKSSEKELLSKNAGKKLLVSVKSGKKSDRKDLKCKTNDSERTNSSEETKSDDDKKGKNVKTVEKEGMKTKTSHKENNKSKKNDKSMANSSTKEEGKSKLSDTEKRKDKQKVRLKTKK